MILPFGAVSLFEVSDEMQARLLRAAVLQLFAVASVTACGSASLPSPDFVTTSPRPPASIPVDVTPPAPPPSVGSLPPAPSELPAGTSGTPAVDPFAQHDAPELEELLPDQVGAATLTKYSVAGERVATPGSEEALAALLDATTGGGLDDLAFAAAFDPTGTVRAAVTAVRVTGSDERSLVDALALMRQGALGPGAAIDDADIGGVEVTRVAATVGDGVITQYLFGHGDIVFMIEAADEANAVVMIQAVVDALGAA